MSDEKLIERPLTRDDAPALVKLLAVISDDIGTNRRYRPETVQMDWEEPGMDITKSSLGIFTPDGEIIAYLVFWDNFEVPVHPWLEWAVHPDYRNQNLSAKLLDWVDNRKANLVSRCPEDTKISIQCSTVLGYTPVENSLQNAGYDKIRISYDMRIDMDKKPPVPQLADGLKFRNYRHDEDLEAFITTFRNSFSDHFGYVEEPFEKDMEEFRHWFEIDELFDPQYFFFVVDEASDKVAGYILAFKEEHGDPTVGHIHLVGVHRDYRRRGIAQAMLHHAFNIFWENGRKSVSLGVDGDSLTNAVALYERVGMHIHRQYVRYEKVLRDGKELATVAVEP